MSGISTDRAAAADEAYDLVVVGGGICGAMTVLQAARTGLRVLLLERDDFGGATSASSMGILHGGPCGLRPWDLKGCLHLARERAWLAESFGDYIQPLACIMPLAGKWHPCVSVFRAAAALRERLTARTAREHSRPWRAVAHIIDRKELGQALEPMRLEYPRALAWNEARVHEPQRLLMALLGWAAGRGAVCLNYVEAEQLEVRTRRVTGILARDRQTGSGLAFRTPRVINCAGPWSRPLGAAWDHDYSRLFRPSVAFNLWLDIEPPAGAHALRVPGRVGSRDALWIVPLSRGVLVGTRRLPWSGPPESPIVAEEDILGFLQTLRDAVPGSNPRLEHVLRVYAGLVPAKRVGGAIAGPVFIDHGARGGPAGLYSVSGAGYTSARLVAERSLCRIFGPRIRLAPKEQPRPTPLEPPSIHEMVGPFRQHAPLCARVRQLCERESVVHLDDIVLRRTNWATCPQYLGQIAETVCTALRWDESRRITEKARLALALRQSGSACSLAVPRLGERPPSSHIGHSIA